MSNYINVNDVVLVGELTPGNLIKFDSVTGKMIKIRDSGASSAGLTSNPGGSSSSIQFNNSGDFGGSSKLIWDNSNNIITISGDGTSVNNGRIVANNIKLSATESESSIYLNSVVSPTSGGLFINLAVNGTSKVKVDKDGNITSTGLLTLDPLGNYSSGTGLVFGADGMLIHNSLSESTYFTMNFVNPDELFLFTSGEEAGVDKSAVIAIPSYDTNQPPLTGMLMLTDEYENRIAIGGGAYVGNAATDVYIYTKPINERVGTVRASWNENGLFTQKGLSTFIGVPTAATLAGATVSINPATAAAGTYLQSWGVGGTDYAHVTADGSARYGNGTGNVSLSVHCAQAAANYADITIGGGSAESPSRNWRLRARGNTGGYDLYSLSLDYMHSTAPIYDVLRFRAKDGSIWAGKGNHAQKSLSANLDQDDVMIHRDVDGASTYSEAGSLLHLWRDVTNATATTGNFLEWSNDGATALGYIDTDGSINTTSNATIGGTLGVGGQSTFTGIPTGATLSGASLSINPASATALYHGLSVGVNNVEKFYVTAAEGDVVAHGVVSIGASTPTVRFGQGLSVATSTSFGGASLSTWAAASGNSSLLDLNRSKSTKIGTHLAVANNDSLGGVVFRGSDGTGFISAAFISGEVDGTVGINDMPGRLIFATTPDGSAAATERMRIDSAGLVSIVNNATIGGTLTSDLGVRSGLGASRVEAVATTSALSGAVTLAFGTYTTLQHTVSAEITSWVTPTGIEDGETVTALIDITGGTQTVATPAHSGALIMGTFDMSAASEYFVTINRIGSKYIWAVTELS